MDELQSPWIDPGPDYCSVVRSLIGFLVVTRGGVSDVLLVIVRVFFFFRVLHFLSFVQIHTGFKAMQEDCKLSLGVCAWCLSQLQDPCLG